MLLSYHMVGPVSDGLVPRCRNTLLGVSVTEAASLHYQVIDGEVLGGKSFVCGGEVFGLAGARLPPQQSDSDVGHPQLLLALRPKRIQGLPLRQGTVDHLLVRETSAVTFHESTMDVVSLYDFYVQMFLVGRADVNFNRLKCCLD